MESRLGLRERLEHSRLKGSSDAGAPNSSMKEITNGIPRLGLSKASTDPVVNQQMDRSALPNDDNDDDADSIDGETDPNEEEGDEDAEDAPNEEEEEEDDDDDGPTPESPSVGGPAHMKVMHSRYPNRPPIVCFDYPLDLGVTRTYGNGIVVEEVDTSTCPVFFKCYWERNCIKNAFFRAGLARIKTGKKWTAAWIKHMPRSKFKLLQSHQRLNHFPDPWVIGRKDRLMKTLVAMKRKFGADYSFIPDGYLLPSQRDVFLRCLDRDAMSPATAQSLWIIKPPASACGRGIKVIHPSQVESLKKSKKLVVQRYLASPYLINGYKFDLRIYVVVTSFDPLRIYLFQEGLARFCTVKYSTSHLKNRLAHLTNFSVNKTNATFKASESEKDTDGSKWSWTALMAYLADQGHDVDVLRGKMKAIICKTMIAAEAHITPLTQSFVKHRNVCYELFGFDMMIDSALEPWLIEVNVSPSLMGSSPLDKRIKGLLMSDIFHLVGHPVSMPPSPDLPPLPRSMSKSFANLNHASTSTPPKKPPASSSKASTISPLVARKQLLEVLHDPNIKALTPAHLALFRDDDWDIVLSMEDEADRVGHFERIYPAADDATYAPYFAVSRYANRLCEKWRAMQPPYKPPGPSTKSGSSQAPSPTVNRPAAPRRNSTPSKPMKVPS